MSYNQYLANCYYIKLLLECYSSYKCDCDYASGGCIVSKRPKFGCKCKCSYQGFWTCGSSGHIPCSASEIGRGKCQGDKTIGSCAGDCGGY